MQDYGAAFINFSGSYPDTLAVNASGPSATDGTEFVANMINDSMWGVWQMILNRAGLSPNGVLESDSASQIREALQKGFGGAPGTVQQWHLASDPGTTGHRCLLLNGQGILRASYPDLDAACYVGDGNNAAVAAAGGGYYRADDAAGTTPNIVGIYLILPETRGYVPRGLDTAASVDPDGASRYLGDVQLDAFDEHTHGLWSAEGGSDVSVLLLDSNASYVGGDDAGAGTNPGYAYTAPVGAQDYVEKVGGDETRMVNFSTKFVVWY